MLRSQLENYVRGSNELTKVQLSRRMNISEASTRTFKIFICHSSSDIDEILKIKAYLKKVYHWDAYVAEVDAPQMNPAKANKTTANILKNRMEHSENLYFVLSKNSQRSTWMPWELGYFNGIKKDDNKIKILPITEYSDSEITSFEGHEY